MMTITQTKIKRKFIWVLLMTIGTCHKAASSLNFNFRTIKPPRQRSTVPFHIPFHVDHHPRNNAKKEGGAHRLRVFGHRTLLGVTGGDTTHADTSQRGNSLLGRSLLILVSFLYGTLNVCLRRVYSLDHAPTAPALSATRGWLSAVCFLHVPFQAAQQKTISSQSTDDNKRRGIQPTRKLLWFTAFDLAIWNFLAQGLINIGLIYVPSARASFLTQSSVIFTPLLSFGVLGHSLPPSLWMGVALAFVGLCILSSGTTKLAVTVGTTAASSSVWRMVRQWWQSIHVGDGLVLAGALSWSIYLIRLSQASSPDNNKHGIDFPTLPLQAIKTLIMATMYTCWWMLNSCVAKPSTATQHLGWWTSGVAWAWLAISAIGPGALADVLQQKGQQHVSASEANVILSTEPVFSAVCGVLLLGEIVTKRDLTGGALILMAALLSSLSS